jgi:anti-anti-sigma factor
MASAPQLKMALKQSLGEGRGIVADLSEVTFIDSSVIHVLFDTDSALAGQGKQLALQINTASIVMRALQITGLTSLPYTPERETAIAIAATPRGEREPDGDLV